VKNMRATRRILHFLILLMIAGIVATLWNHHDDSKSAAVTLEVAEEIDALVILTLLALMLEAVFRWRIRRRPTEPSEF
jgi:hypothetical protein